MADFMLLFRGGHAKTATLSPEQLQAHMQEWGAWMTSLRASGVVIGADRLKEASKLVSPDKTISDGPFTEAKEYIGGYVTVAVPNLEAALEISLRCPIYKTLGYVEVRQVEANPFVPKTAIRGYTDAWMSGDLAKAKSFLADQVKFSGPLASLETASDLIKTLENFRKIFKSATIATEIYSGNCGFLLYDCVIATPNGKIRCAESFQTSGGKITANTLVFDATEMNRLAGR